MKKRAKIRVVLMGFLMMILVSGCQKEPASTNPLPTVTPIETVDNSTQKPKEPEDDSKEQNLGSFDMEEVRKNLWINGKQFSLPCTIEDLGEEYYYDELWTDYEDDGELIGYASGMFSEVYGDNFENRISTFVKADGSDNYEKMDIFYLSINDKNKTDLKIYTIGIGSTDKEVEERFGKPTESSNAKDNSGKMYSYKIEDNYMSFIFDSQNGIRKITIRYLEEEKK